MIQVLAFRNAELCVAVQECDANEARLGFEACLMIFHLKFKIHHSTYFYSVFKLFTGFCIVVFAVCKTISIAVTDASDMTEIKNGVAFMATR